MASLKVYQIITDQIVARLEEAIAQTKLGNKGLPPWNRPWHEIGLPSNLVTKKPYRGINVFLTMAAGFSSPWFLSFKQIKKLGGRIKQDENGQLLKPLLIVFWNWIEINEDNDGKKLEKPKKVPFLRYYSVWNLEQLTGIDEKHIPKTEKREFNPIQDAEKIIENMKNRPVIEHGEPRAFYRPSTDIVNMPKHELFKSDESYYATIFHELTHATGHQKRLARKGVIEMASFGSHNYSTEELVAEMGAIFLCNECGITATFENNLAYLQNWLKAFKDDPKMVVTAGGQAQKATDYILGITWENKKDTE